MLNCKVPTKACMLLPLQPLQQARDSRTSARLHALLVQRWHSYLVGPAQLLFLSSACSAEQQHGEGMQLMGCVFVDLRCD